MSSRTYSISALLLVALMWTWSAAAQTTELTVQVTTRKGRAIRDASVELTSTLGQQVNRIATGRTDARGEARLVLDVEMIRQANAKGTIWKVTAEKLGYEIKSGTIDFRQPSAPSPATLQLAAHTENSGLVSRVDACSQDAVDGRTLYFFSFAHDEAGINKMKRFHEVLETKLIAGIRHHLASRGLLTNAAVEFRWCHSAVISDKADALFALRRLDCPGIVWGFIETVSNTYRSSVSFTAIPQDPISSLAFVQFEADLERLANTSQRVHEDYLAFAAFVLGNVYLEQRQTTLAQQCFLHVQELNCSAGSEIVVKSRALLEELKKANAASDLVPIGG